MRSYFRAEIIISLTLIALSLLTFGHVCLNEFLDYDDSLYVTNNEQVQAGLTVESAFWAVTSFEHQIWHPLTWLSLQLDWELYGPQAWGFHLSSLLLHTANSVLVFVVLHKMTGAMWRSALAAAFFAVHPFHVEPVAWVSSRKDVLGLFFALLTMLAYAWYAAKPGLARYGLVPVAFAAALGAKSVFVILPCILVLLDYWPLRRMPWSPEDQGTVSFPRAQWLLVIAEKLPLLTLSWFASQFAMFAQMSTFANVAIPVEYRIGNALVALVTYAGKTFWPVYFPIHYAHPGTDLPLWKPLCAGVLLMALTIVAITNARTRPWLLVGWLWFVGSLVPVCGIIPGGQTTASMADRYVYLPMLGLLIAGAWIVPETLWMHSTSRRLTIGVIAIGLLFCAGLSWQQVLKWQNGVSLFQHAVSMDPENAFAHSGLGAAFYADGREEEAIPSYEHAVRLMPSNARFRRILAGGLRRMGRDEEARRHEKAIRLPNQPSEPP